MNIGIVPTFKEKNLTGINRVTIETLKQLLQMDKINNYSFIGDCSWLKMDLPYVDIMDSNVEITKLSFLLMSKQYDIIHSHFKAFKIKDSIPCGKIITIHDIVPLLHPEWSTKLSYKYFDEGIRHTVHHADVIIAMSEHTKKDIIEYYHINDDKIHVIYSGLPSSFNENVELKELKIDYPYILSVSALGKNKNQEGMLKAFVWFKERNPDNKIKFVMTGPNRNVEKIEEYLKKYPFIEKDVIFTGFVTDSELKYLYKNAIAFIYVSLYEGFGLPILEAMALGKAVICSNTTSMPEIGGEAVEYCNPYDIESIENAIENVVLNSTLRKSLEEKAVVQAAKFSYKKAAEETLKIYKTFE